MNKTTLALKHRLGAACVVAVTLAMGLSACGGSTKAVTASFQIKSIAAIDASAKTSATTKKMPANMKMPATTKSSLSGGLPTVASSAYGEAYLHQVGDHLTGWRKVWGLIPNSAHADHLHGPDGSCSPPSKQVSNMAVVLPDLKANVQGYAYGTINLIVHEAVVGRGYFLVVHAKPTPADELNQIGSAPASMAFMQSMSNDPAILCGTID